MAFTPGDTRQGEIHLTNFIQSITIYHFFSLLNVPLCFLNPSGSLKTASSLSYMLKMILKTDFMRCF